MRASDDVIDDLEDPFHHVLAQQYTIEERLVETIDEMAITTSNDRLRDARCDPDGDRSSCRSR